MFNSKTKLSVCIFFVASLLFTADACKKKEEISDDELTIRLRWNTGFSGESYSNVETGLLWSLSYLGAEMPNGSLPLSVTQPSAGIIDMKLFHAGFTSVAEAHLAILIQQLKNSAEYKAFGAIDIGRFLMYLLYSPYHYYAITNAEKRLDAFESRYFTASRFRYPVTNSAVSSHERLITFSPASSALNIAFMAEDGIGNVEDNSFQTDVHECWTVMKNGQLRYAIYDKQGNLQASSSSKAGKPGKCMWCHEIVVQPLFSINTDLPGYLTQVEFSAWVTSFGTLLNNYRNTLNGEIDFSKKEDHTFAELLYTTFMEPSVSRLSLEWNMPEPDVLARLNGLATHTNLEYPWMGDLYHRKEVDALSPYDCVRIPDDVREKSSYEPDIFYLSR